MWFLALLMPPRLIAAQGVDGAGRTTVRAVRVTGPMRIDGQLDEAVYRSVPSMSDFVQETPHEGAPATQKTEAWLLFDDDRIYVVAFAS